MCVECPVTSDLCGLRPVAVIRAGGRRKAWEGGHYGSICQQCTVSLSLPLSPSITAASLHLFSLHRHLSFPASHLSPNLKSPLLISLSFQSFSFHFCQIPCCPSVNHSPPSFPLSPLPPLLIFLLCQLPSPHSSPMATCHSVNLFISL